MEKIIAFINKKGGVAKTTSACAIAQILAMGEYSVLVVDMDLQQNATREFGVTDYEPDENYEKIYTGKMTLDEMEYQISQTNFTNVDLIPSCNKMEDMSNKIYDMSKETNAEFFFRKNLRLLNYDYIILDIGPSKDYLSKCALIAADLVYTPFNSDGYSYDGIRSLIQEIMEVNEKYSLSCEFGGAFMTKVKNRTSLFNQLYKQCTSLFGDAFIPVFIRDCVAVMESNTNYIPLLEYDKGCNAVEDYDDLVKYMGLMDTKHYRKFWNKLHNENVPNE